MGYTTAAEAQKAYNDPANWSVPPDEVSMSQYLGSSSDPGKSGPSSRGAFHDTMDVLDSDTDLSGVYSTGYFEDGHSLSYEDKVLIAIDRTMGKYPKFEDVVQMLEDNEVPEATRVAVMPRFAASQDFRHESETAGRKSRQGLTVMAAAVFVGAAFLGPGAAAEGSLVEGAAEGGGLLGAEGSMGTMAGVTSGAEVGAEVLGAGADAGAGSSLIGNTATYTGTQGTAQSFVSTIYDAGVKAVSSIADGAISVYDYLSEGVSSLFGGSGTTATTLATDVGGGVDMYGNVITAATKSGGTGLINGLWGAAKANPLVAGQLLTTGASIIGGGLAANSAKETSTANRESQENTSAADRTSRETTSAADRLSRENISKANNETSLKLPAAQAAAKIIPGAWMAPMPTTKQTQAGPLLDIYGRYLLGPQKGQYAPGRGPGIINGLIGG